MDALADALKVIPPGWCVTIEWQQDSWPCVEVTLSRDFGRDSCVGRGNDADLSKAIQAAVQEAVALISP